MGGGDLVDPCDVAIGQHLLGRQSASSSSTLEPFQAMARRPYPVDDAKRSARSARRHDSGRREHP